ncbi:Apoptosis inhibitor 5-like protein, partial [Drosera capensis]
MERKSWSQDSGTGPIPSPLSTRFPDIIALSVRTPENFSRALTKSTSGDSSDVDKLYEYGEQLNEANDKSLHVEAYKGIIRATKGSIKAKQLAALFIPWFFKFFPDLSSDAVYAHLDLCEEEVLGVGVQAIRGLPLFAKDMPENLGRIVDILARLLMAESLTGLFKHFSIQATTDEVIDENVRDKVLSFIKEKVFSLKAELLKPQEHMERHITDLIKKILQDVMSGEFKMFIQFLKSLSLFGGKASPKKIQELIEIPEGQADLDAQFDARPIFASDLIHVSDIDHIERFQTCISLAIPFFMRGGSNSRFLHYVAKHIHPALDKLPEERKLEILKNFAEISPIQRHRILARFFLQSQFVTVEASLCHGEQHRGRSLKDDEDTGLPAQNLNQLIKDNPFRVSHGIQR